MVAAVLTPFDEQLRPDPRAAIPYYSELLERGCDGLNIMGTTGEAMSIGLADRIAFMEELSEALPRDRVMVGTGASALADAITLTSAAIDAGLRALVIAPFYYRDATEDGIVRFHDALFSRAYVKPESVLLYHFPRMSGITMSADLIDRIVQCAPGVVCGMKDSANDIALEKTVHEQHPELSIFCGSEEFLPQTRAAGLAGCISGSVALWPELAAQAWKSGDGSKLDELTEKRKSIGAPFIHQVRQKLAMTHGDSWTRSIPPLE